MKAPPPKMPELRSDQNEGTTNAFFDQWHVYDQIIRFDYMQHRAIHDALGRALSTWRPTSFSVLDLGCGDASRIRETLQDRPVRAYTGIDVSAVALSKAEAHFAGAPCRVTLIQADLLDYLANATTPRSDVVVAGFTVHHLKRDEKQAFFRSCFARLSAPGDLFLYDVLLRPGESRDHFLKSYFENCDRRWRGIPPEDLEKVKQHAYSSDYPETYEALAEMARSAGFTAPPAPLFADEYAFHGLCHFRRRATHEMPTNHTRSRGTIAP